MQRARREGEVKKKKFKRQRFSGRTHTQQFVRSLTAYHLCSRVVPT